MIFFFMEEMAQILSLTLALKLEIVFWSSQVMQILGAFILWHGRKFVLGQDLDSQNSLSTGILL